MKTRIFSMLLAIVLLFTTVDITVFAEEIKGVVSGQSVSGNEIETEVEQKGTEEIKNTEGSRENLVESETEEELEEIVDEEMTKEESGESENASIETVEVTVEIEEGVLEDETEGIYIAALREFAYYNEIMSVSDIEYKLTEEQLFLQCPQYLNSNAVESYLNHCVSYTEDAMDKVSDTETLLSSFFYSLKNGEEVLTKHIASSCGLTTSEHTDLKKAMAVELIKEYTGTEEFLTDTVGESADAFSKIDRFYDFSSDMAKSDFKQQLKSSSKKLSDADVDKIVDSAFSKEDTIMEAADSIVELADIIITVVALQDIELTVIDDLMISLESSYDTDLYEGLIMVRNDITDDISTYVLNNFLTDKAIKYFVDMFKEAAKELIFDVTNIKFTLPTKWVAKCIVERAAFVWEAFKPSVDDIMYTTIMYTYYRSLETATLKWRSHFLRGDASVEDIAYYKAAYKGQLCAIKLMMKHANGILEVNDRALKTALETYRSAIGETITYESYINLCLKEATAAINNGTLVLVENGSIDKTEDGTVLDDTYDSTESIKAKLNVIMQKYVPDVNQYWKDDWGGAIQCFGFVRMVFNKLYGCDMPYSYYKNKRYEYTTDKNVTLIGQLEESEVTASNIQQMFSNAHIGDVIQGYGTPYGQHTMMLLGVTDDGIRTYECNYNGECGIYRRTYTWSKLASRYGTGDSKSGNGISLYHANNYEKIYGNGDDLFYDDSVNFVISDGVLTKYNGWQNFVTIPDTVTAIGDNAFKNNTSVMTVSIPDSVTSIGDYAFYGCSNLLGAVIPDSVETIGTYAFFGCKNMASVSLSENEKFAVIDERVFYECTGLKSIFIPNNVTEIRTDAFLGCIKLKSVTLSQNLKTMWWGAFYGCDSLTDITIPKSLESIEEGNHCSVFAECDNLKNIYFEEGITRIIPSLMYNAIGIERIVIPDTVTEIGGYAFADCENLKEVIIPESVTEIGYNAFYACTSIEDISLPSSITEIGEEAFAACSGLTEVVLPDSVTELGQGAFARCTNLKSIELSANLVSMKGKVFYRCTSLEEIEIPKSLENAAGYPFGGKQGDFYECMNLKRISFEEGTTHVVPYLFMNAESLEEISLPDTITSVGDGAFLGCSNLTSIHMPSKLDTIGGHAFEGCSMLESISIPQTVTEVGDYAFQDCMALTEITIPDNVTKIGLSTFENCTSLEKIDLGMGITDISSYAFAYCSSLTKIILPNGTTRIYHYAFLDCPNLTEITIPRSVTYIGMSVFSYPEKMTIYGIPGTNAENYANTNNIDFVSIAKPIESIVFAKNEFVIKRGERTRIPISITPIDYTDEITWLSEDESIVFVDAYGKIWGRKVGITTITATSGNISASCTVTVLQPITSISIADIPTELNAGETVTLIAQVLPENASNPAIAWESSDEEVASVSSEGIVTAKKKGSAIIKAIALDGSNVSEEIELVVKNNLYSANTYDELQSSHPYSNDCNDIWEYIDEGKHFLWVTFTEDTCIDDSDSLLLYDGEFNLLGEYTGDELAEKTVRVYGDTIKIQLISDGIGTAYGFTVEKIETDADIQFPAMEEEEKGVLPEDIPEGGIEEIPDGLWIAGINSEGYEYTGTAVRPNVRVYDSTTRLVEKEDYIITYKNNVKVGDASAEGNVPTIIIEGKGNYSGRLNCKFSIVPKDIMSEEIIAQELTVKYNGKTQKKVPSITWSGKKLRNKLDYIIEYPDLMIDENAYKEPGTYSILLKGIGNFSGEKNISITITEDELISKAYIANIAEQSYTGSAIIPELTIRYGLKLLKEGTDYTVSYINNIEIGTATAIVVGMGKYAGEKRVTFNIKGKELAKAVVRNMPSVFVYKGDNITFNENLSDNMPELVVTENNKQVVLIEGIHYSIEYKNNIDKGIAVVTFNGIGSYCGKLTQTFRILPYDIDEDTSDLITVYLSSNEIEYEKGGNRPNVIVMYGTSILESGKDYTLSYKNYNRVNAGSDTNNMPTVIVEGKGNFAGKVELTYTIKSSSISNEVMNASDKVFVDSAGTFQSEPIITTESGTKLKKGEDYHETLTYCYKEDTVLENGVERKAGDLVEENDIVPDGTTIKVIVIGKGNYEGTINCEYRVVKYDIGKTKVEIPKMDYTGDEITLTDENITVTFGDEELVLGDDFEIISYLDNTERGRAEVTIRGLGDYGGTKTVRFTIKSKLLEWWEGVLEKLFG